jgi:hypothetical protein
MISELYPYLRAKKNIEKINKIKIIKTKNVLPNDFDMKIFARQKSKNK